VAGDHVAVAITGLDELYKALDDLGTIGSKQVMTEALKVAAQPIADTARRLARVGTGPKSVFKKRIRDIEVRTTLSKSQMRKRGGRRAEAEVFVGSQAPHAHLIEFGHRLVKGRSRKGEILSHKILRVQTGRERGRFLRHIVKRGPATFGRQIGRVRAYPFLRPAFDAHKGQLFTAFAREVGKRLGVVARRYAGQARRGKLSRGAQQAYRVELRS